MKYKYLFIIPIVFLLCSCTPKLDIPNNITSITYKDNPIYKDDYNAIISIINKSHFKKSKDDNIIYDLVITTDNNIFKFSFKNNTIYYLFNNTLYQNKDNYTTLVTKLNELTNKYEEHTYYNIYDLKNYTITEKDQYIKLDESSSFFLITTTKDLINFKIHEIETNNNEYKDISVLYENEFISKNKTTVIKKNIEQNPIRISFNNQYNYTISIIPYIQNNTIKYKKTVKKNS